MSSSPLITGNIRNRKGEKKNTTKPRAAPDQCPAHLPSSHQAALQKKKSKPETERYAGRPPSSTLRRSISDATSLWLASRPTSRALNSRLLMESTSAAYPVRRRSFGRGGAGNIRSHAEATVEGEEGYPGGRRSSGGGSIKSTSTSASHRSKLFLNDIRNLFTSITPTKPSTPE